MLDYELELAAVIGREGRDVAEADGLAYVAGFTILCDWSARDLQRDESQVGLGPAKGKDFCTSLGPLLVTTDELAPYLKDGRLAVRCTLRVNGETWMVGDGGTMHHTWGQLVERAAHDSRIVPGDVFGSGTVGGGTVGEAMHGRLRPGALPAAGRPGGARGRGPWRAAQPHHPEAPSRPALPLPGRRAARPADGALAGTGLRGRGAAGRAASIS